MQRYTAISSAEDSGYLTVDVDGDVWTVDLFGDNNGRGAKHKERLVLQDGFPIERDLAGTSLTGGPIEETFRWTPERAVWTSPADEGEVEDPDRRLYIASELSPVSVALYAARAIEAGGRIEVLPAGEVEARVIRSVTLSARPEVALTAYAVTGLGLLPEIVVLDDERRLVAYWDLVMDFVRDDFLVDVRTTGSEIAALGAALRAELVGEIGRAARLDVTSHEPVHFVDVRVFDPHTLTVGPPSRVTVFDSRIATIEPLAGGTAPTGGVVIDGEGGTLVPGLHDMHAHLGVWPALIYTAGGITGARDMGNDNDVFFDNIRRWRSGELPGPTKIDYSGFIEGRSPYSARAGFIIDTLEEGIQAVRWYADRGFSRIKIYNSMNPEWVRPLAQEARRLGMETLGHIPAFTTPRAMIEAGYSEVTHVNQLILSWLLEEGEDTRTLLRLTGLGRAKDFDVNAPEVVEFIEYMREHGIGLDTTLLPMEELLLSRERVGLPSADSAQIDHLPIGFQRKRKRAMLPSDEETLADFEQAFPKLVELVGAVHRAGVPVWPGTDNGTCYTLHRELELYVEAGIPAAEVLRIATLDAARRIGFDQRSGSIERGKDADFLLVDGDPTADIRRIRHVRAVSNQGTVYFPDRIYTQLGIRPWVTPVTVR